MKLKILELPNPILRQKSLDVPQVNDEIKKLLADMLETMYSANGVGLAGPQIGVSQRLVVIDPARGDEKPTPYKMVNPRIVGHSEELQEYTEGCLSIPNQYAKVERYLSVLVNYLDENGQEKTLNAEGFFAVALQHELDHLEGIVFIDHLSKLKQKIMLKKQEKRQKRLAETAEE